VEYEEIEVGQPEDDGPAGLSPLTWVALAVGCVLVGLVFMLFHGPPEPVAAPPPSPTASSPFSGIIGGQGINTRPDERLALGRICPAVTDGSSTLAVSFTLVNISTRDVTLLDVEPVLPIGGLKPHGPNTAGGTCEHPLKETPGGLLGPGATQLITMHFRLPKECPQPFPVQAQIKLRANQMVGMTTVGVYSDLGSIDFDTCPRPES
jgi:hypothetical protein